MRLETEDPTEEEILKPKELTWNKRVCTGNRFHEAALNGELALVERLLILCPGIAHSRFTWMSAYKGRPQTNSGLAIHMAASRGHIEVVGALVRAGVSLQSKTMRDGEDNYDVLHAAVWAEGKGGSLAMVSYLLNNGATLTPNKNSESPIHLAFQVGALDLLAPLRKHAKAQGVWHSGWSESAAASPLTAGIRTGHMSGKQLAEFAATVPMSLHIFIDQEPRCLRMFLRRLQGVATAEQLAAHVAGKDIAKVLREHPDAACALFEALTATPRCEEKGLYPLPARVSFAPRTKLEMLRDMVNPTPELLSFYERGNEWKFQPNYLDGEYAWQSQIESRKWGNPIRDAEIRVCHVPNLVCTEIFAALVQASGRDSANKERLRPFKDPLFVGVINWTWWHGAARFEMCHAVFSVWGLLLLICDTALGFGTGVSVDFVWSKGIVDSLMLLAKAVGWLRSRLPLSEFFCRKVIWDVSRCVFPLLLPYAEDKWVMVAIIFTYWLQLLGAVTLSENVSRSILPITRLAMGLIPAGVLSLVWFCAFLHAFQVCRQNGETPWIDNLFDTFGTLFTGELHIGDDSSGLQAFLSYAAVAVFTVYLLNIFIGVIGTQFQAQKDMSKETFQLVRADKCLTYLTRAQVLPVRRVTRTVAARVAWIFGVLSFIVQIRSLVRGHTCWWMRATLVPLQLAIVLTSYQDSAAQWSCERDENMTDRRYLWLVQIRDPEKPEPHIDEEEGAFESTPGSDLDRW